MSLCLFINSNLKYFKYLSSLIYENVFNKIRAEKSYSSQVLIQSITVTIMVAFETKCEVKCFIFQAFMEIYSRNLYGDLFEKSSELS